MTVDDVNALQRWLCMKWWVHYKDQVDAPPCKIYETERPMAHDGDPLHGV
jgi:hypothetical protein